MSEYHDIEAILAWIPPRDRDWITAYLAAEVGEHADWTLAALVAACRRVAR